MSTQNPILTGSIKHNVLGDRRVALECRQENDRLVWYAVEDDGEWYATEYDSTVSEGVDGARRVALTAWGERHWDLHLD